VGWQKAILIFDLLDDFARLTGNNYQLPLTPLVRLRRFNRVWPFGSLSPYLGVRKVRCISIWSQLVRIWPLWVLWNSSLPPFIIIIPPSPLSLWN